MAIGWRANQGSGPPSGAATGDLAGTYPNPSVAALRGVPVSPTAPTIIGQVIRWNGSVWAPAITDSSDVAYAPGVPASWSPVPTTVEGGLDQLMALHRSFGLVVETTRRTTPLTTATLPGPSPYAGASDYLSIGTSGDPIPLDPGTYAAWVGYIVSVDQNNTEFWIDASVLGAPSAEGPSNQPLGKANAQANSTFTLTFDVVAPLDFYATIRVAKGGGAGNVTFRAAYAVLTRLL